MKASSQVEGMVADSRRGFVFAAQEDVGLWPIPIGGGTCRAEARRPRARVRQTYTRTPDPEEEGAFVREFDGSSPTAGSEYLAADSEG